MPKAIVFAYHNVGARCLKTLISFGIEIPLLITHQDNPKENIWFENVAKIATSYDIPILTPQDPNIPEIIEKIVQLKPDFIFSFYYRHLLKAELLKIPKQGAFNMHGSLLPLYRGRVPINWAIIHGETQTGMTLHQMDLKADNGPIVDQMAIPILADDTAQDVFNKTTVAAEIILLRSLPNLCAGTAKLTVQDLSLATSFRGRKPEDGLILPNITAKQIHDFVRALTRPYPGAFINISGEQIIIWKTRLLDKISILTNNKHKLINQNGKCLLYAAGGGILEIVEMSQNDKNINPISLLTKLEKTELNF